MKAVLMRGYGGNAVVSVADIPVPPIGTGDVLVEVRAAGVNAVDVKMRNGAVKVLQPCRFPQIMGMELVGIVAQRGAQATRFRVGDEVYGRIAAARIGSFAEYCAVDERDLCLKPALLSIEAAAAVPLAALTCRQALVEVARLQPGQRVFIKGGSGGTGTFAIQYAKALGAEVATSTGPSNVERVKRLGADHVVDYTKQNFEDVLENYDLVLDLVGGEPIHRGFSILKPGGHLVSLADKPNAEFAKSFGLNPVIQLACAWISRKESRRAKATGARYTFFYVAPSGEHLSEVSELVEAGRITPVIDRVFPLGEVREAFDYIAAGRSKGKVVLRMLTS